MLKALTRHKTGRVDRESLLKRTGLLRFEDPLTATVFGRLAYLPPQLAWTLLRQAIGWTLDGRPWRKTPPKGGGTWRFWPSYPDPTGAQTRIEPDVVWSFEDGSALVIEAKHHDGQRVDQWLAEIQAVLAAEGVARVLLLAVGDAVPTLAPWDLERLRDAGAAAVAHVAWPDLAVAASSVEGLAPHVERVVQDIISALTLWGYPPRVWFDTLPCYATGTPLGPGFEPLTIARKEPAGFGGFGAAAPLDPAALDAWRPAR